MKYRTQLYLVSVIMTLAILVVVAMEVGLWVFNQKQIQTRNYVGTCLNDVFELNLLTHELNFFQDIDRPIDQMEIKIKILSEKFDNSDAEKVFNTSEIEAVRSTLKSIRVLLGYVRDSRSKLESPEMLANQNEFVSRVGVQLLQRSQTLYGAFTLMRARLVTHEKRAELVISMLRAGSLIFLCVVMMANTFLLQRRMMRSLLLLETGAAEVTQGNVEFMFTLKDKGHRDEIDAVKSAFNVMVRSLNKASLEINKKNKELETLLYVISHDLKEPLRSVEYFSNIVRERYAQSLNTEAQDFLARSANGAIRMRLLLDNITTLSKTRTITLPTEMVPAKDIVRGALERLELKIRESGAVIRVAENLPQLKADPMWAQEAIYNLISNALKYVKPGEKPQIDIVSYDANESGYEEHGLVVQDRGPGVSPNIAERIFVLFQRGVGRNIEGTGAGLAIVKAVAEQHQGRAWVEPREGGGSRFIITFNSGGGN